MSDDDFPEPAPGPAFVDVSVAGLARGATQVFPFERDGWPTGGIVYRDDAGQLYVYANRCPHVPYTLDFGDGRLLTDDGRAMMCANHGATFDPRTGHCIGGPARGRYLEHLPFEALDGDTAIRVTIPPEPADWPRTYRPPGCTPQ